MKKYFITLIVLMFSCQFGYSQAFISISPDAGVRGQTVNTTITATGFFFTWGSAPGNFNDFYMRQNTSYIYPNFVSVIDDDNLLANWTIPTGIPVGYYDVIWDSWFMGFPVQYTIPGGFDVGDAFVTGKVFWDADSSLTQNGSENGMFNQKLLLLPDSATTFTQADGNYALGSTLGNKTVQVQPGPLWNITTSPTLAVNVNSPVVPGNNFGLKGITDIYAIDVSITGAMIPRCWRPATYIITYTNTGTITTHGEVKYTLPAGVTFDSSTPAFTSVLGNTYTWAYTNLLPGETRNIVVITTLPGPGFTITSSVQANAQNPSNAIVYQDEQFITQTVICAFDPNDKSVIPEGVQIPHYTLMSDSLDFVIRFQNTGNDTAFKVVILDTLDKNVLDLNTFQLITYSHPVVVDLRTNGKLTFTFDNILLPDSNVNEMGSHGFVRFRCLAKTGLPAPTVLNNTSYIYFDFNAPVVTNTTLNTLVYQIPVGLTEVNAIPGVSVMPNPVTSDAIFTLPDAGEEFELKIYDSAGRLLYSKLVSGNKAVVPSRELKKGVLYYRVRSQSGKHDHTGKFVVM
jgi:hypothetical protein